MMKQIKMRNIFKKQLNGLKTIILLKQIMNGLSLEMVHQAKFGLKIEIRKRSKQLTIRKQLILSSNYGKNIQLLKLANQSRKCLKRKSIISFRLELQTIKKEKIPLQKKRIVRMMKVKKTDILMKTMKMIRRINHRPGMLIKT